MASIINAKHRAVSRGGPGAVMGSKNLKADVVRGTQKIPMLNPEKVKKLNAAVLDYMKNGPTAEQVKLWFTYGTGGTLAGVGVTGDAPVKNWGGAGAMDMGEERLTKIATFTYDSKYKVRKYACAQCPLGCGAHYKVDDGKWPVGQTDRPEYETLAAFGTMTLNDDAESIIKCNDIWNRYGLDTISVGASIAWAIECYEKNVLTQKETGGIRLTWGNGEAIVAATQAIADRAGFGKILALGSVRAAQILGIGTEYLQTVQGIELPMHDPRFPPMFSKTYKCDPTPAPYVKGGLGIPDFGSPDEVKYTYEGRGEMDLAFTCYSEVMSSDVACMFGIGFCVPEGTLEAIIEAVTGWNVDMVQTGKRIMTMRHLFSLREGKKRVDNVLPGRCVGEPPLAGGPLKGITVDHEKLADNFFDAAGWDKESLVPTRKSLHDLGGMEDVIRDFYP
jgi:aldehyde:ferredoxin oxidoreductase